MSRARPCASISAVGSSGSGPVITDGSSQISIARAPTMLANSGAETGVNPRTCRLPRALTSKSPLPWVCAAAQTHGNGLLEVSARGSLQVRGLTPVSAPLFASMVGALAIDICEEPSVMTGPLPDDPTALIDAHGLARDIRKASTARGFALAPKVSVIVDGGGRLHLDALPADIRLRAVPSTDGPRLFVSLGGDAS